DGGVDARALPLSTETLCTLEDNLLLFFTGYSRSASQVLQEQNQKTLRRDEDVERNLNELKDIAVRTSAAIEAGDLGCFAQMLSAQWEQKRRRTASASNQEIDHWYAAGMSNGAIGGNLG